MELKERPKIVHMMHRFDVGGMENGVVKVVNGLDEEFDHHILCLSGYNESFCERIQNPAVSVVSLDKSDGIDLAFYKKLYRYLRSVQPQLVHTRNLATIDLFPLLRLAGVKKHIHSEHGWDQLEPNGSNRKYNMIRRASALCVHRFIAVSQDIHRWLTGPVGIPSSMVVRQYNGVATEKFQPRSDSAVSPLNKQSREPLVIGTVGRLEVVKDQATLMRGFALLRQSDSQDFPKTRLLIVGDGSQREALVRLAHELKIDQDTTFAGSLDAVAEVLQTLDVFVLPSRSEGISNTILEAMASGLPVIATDVGGNPELVTDGTHGLIVPPQDPESMAHAMATYIHDPGLRHQHGVAGRERVVTDFSMDAMMAGYRKIYSDTLLGQ